MLGEVLPIMPPTLVSKFLSVNFFYVNNYVYNAVTFISLVKINPTTVKVAGLGEFFLP